MRSNGWHFAGVSVIVVLAGCSQFPGRSGLPKLGLPSPQATIEATEPKRSTAAKSRQAGAKRTRQATGSEGPAVADALARGRSLEKTGQVDKARKVYEAALQDHPQSVPLLHRLGVVADLQKQHAEAEKFFLAALEVEPRSAEILGDLGYCYYLQAKLNKAHSALAKAVAIDPDSSRHHNNLGLVLGHLKDYDGAFEHFSAAGSEADAYYNMAFVFAAQDLADEAKGCFQEALAADPSHQRAKDALASFEEYERAPAHLRDEDSKLAGGVRYVPYVEGPESGHGDEAIHQASASTSLPASRDVGRATRALQLQSRGLLGRHMQQQRDLSTGSDQDAGSMIEVVPQ